MSHTYSRTQSLLEEFASCFGSADVVVLNKIYASARENIADFNITGKTLFQKACNYHNNVVYCEEFDSAINFLKDELEKTLPAEYSEPPPGLRYEAARGIHPAGDSDTNGATGCPAASSAC